METALSSSIFLPSTLWGWVLGGYFHVGVENEAFVSMIQGLLSV